MTDTVYRAMLDTDMIFRGITNAPDATGPEVPEDCDLEPGKYVWDVNGGKFHPVMAEFVPGGPAPDFQQWVVEIAIALRDQGMVKFSPRILDRLKAEEATLKQTGRL